MRCIFACFGQANWSQARESANRRKTDPAARIGRVVVSPEHRGKKLGDRLMVEAIAQCERLYPKARSSCRRKAT